MSKRGRLPSRRIVRGVLAIYRAQWRLLVLLALMVSVPVGVGAALTSVGIGRIETSSASDPVWAFSLVRAGTQLWQMLGHHFYVGVTERIAGEARYGHERPSLGHVLAHLPVGRLVVADVVYTAGVVIGLTLLVVPGVIFWAWYALVPVIVNLERPTVAAAFRRSRDLVRGHEGQVLALIGGFSLAMWVLDDLLASGLHAIFEHLPFVEALSVTAVELALLPFFGLTTALVTFGLMELRGERPGGTSAAPGRVRRVRRRARA